MRYRLVEAGRHMDHSLGGSIHWILNSTGSFEWNTDDPLNSYVSEDGLHIVPTLTLQSTNISGDQLINGYTLNLTSDNTCTNPDGGPDCVTTSNVTTGAIINPVRSARLTTAGSKSITYGRVEVVAKMPKGDWLWPAIWYSNSYHMSRDLAIV